MKKYKTASVLIVLASYMPDSGRASLSEPQNMEETIGGRWSVSAWSCPK
jgi:hypothetical protein